MVEIITAAHALDQLSHGQSAWLDVRSEGEFHEAAVPGFRNTPILRDQERHEVGLCYRHHGQQAAIELGHRLVDDDREHRVASWLAESPSDAVIGVTCWRGGLRSQIAAEWISSVGKKVQRVRGGYKAMRNELLSVLNRDWKFVVVTGLTGSGKSELLQALDPSHVLDLEGGAKHRGSSFGALPHSKQPTQTNFENQLGLHLRSAHEQPFVEDESRVIGRLHLPEPIFVAMNKSPLVRIHATLDERCRRIYTEYVADRLDTGISPDLLRQELVQNTLKLKNRLGGLLTSQIISSIDMAMQSNDPEAHERWIHMLLTQYYDSRYQHAQTLNQRPVLFEGNYKECNEWIQNRYASPRP